MSVRRYDSPLRYFVQSGSRPGVEHLVELDAFDGNGSCTCEDFTFNKGKHLTAGRGEPTDALRCKHIIEARSALADAIIKQVKKNAKGKKNDARSKDNAG